MKPKENFIKIANARGIFRSYAELAGEGSQLGHKQLLTYFYVLEAKKLEKWLVKRKVRDHILDEITSIDSIIWKWNEGNFPVISSVCAREFNIHDDKDLIKLIEFFNLEQLEILQVKSLSTFKNKMIKQYLRLLYKEDDLYEKHRTLESGSIMSDAFGGYDSYEK